MKSGRKRVLFILLSFMSLLLRANSQSHGRTADGGSSADLRGHFVLVHGSCHGAWCWYKVATLLRSSGHSVTALDLAASGIDPKQANDLRSVSDYFGPLMKFMKSVPSKERVILVGHSLGGLAISKAMEIFPEKIAAAVFVTALMPGPAINVSTLQQESLSRQGPQMDNQFTYGEGPDKPPTAFNFGPNFMATNVYQLCPPEDITLGNTLVRPLRLFSEEELSKEIVLTDKKYGTVPRVFVICEEDKLTQKELLRWMLENNPPHMVLKIKGSDHMVMFSKPLELCSSLQHIAHNYL